LDGPPHALAAAKAGINAIWDSGPAERLAAEHDRYVEAFAAGQALADAGDLDGR
jgi:enoyl-CoA hydratase